MGGRAEREEKSSRGAVFRHQADGKEPAKESEQEWLVIKRQNKKVTE